MSAAAHRAVNLLARLDDPRFDGVDIHHAIEAFDRNGIRIERYVRMPESLLGWIDGEFGGSWSSETALASAYVARDAQGPVGFAAFDARSLRFAWLRGWAARPDVGIFGPFGVAKRARGTGLGRLLLRGALFSLRERGYAGALIPAVGTAPLRAYYGRYANAAVVESFELRPRRAARTVVLASGNGSNFAAVLERARAGALAIDIAGVVSNRADAVVIERAARARIPATVVRWNRSASSRAAYDALLAKAVAAYEPELVLLLGWMHVLPLDFLQRFPETLNLHPAFLPLDPLADSVTMPDGSTIPALRGAHAIDDAFALGLAWTGASVHRTRAAVDRGEILARAPLMKDSAESKDAFVERLHALERDVVGIAVRRWTFEQPNGLQLDFCRPAGGGVSALE